jgi:hypothetical protein
MKYPDDPNYVAGSDTSLAAAEEIAGDAATLREKVWRHIAGTGSKTCDEVEMDLRMRHQTASARIRELVLAGRLTNTGRRQLTRSGRLAACAQSRGDQVSDYAHLSEIELRRLTRRRLQERPTGPIAWQANIDELRALVNAGAAFRWARPRFYGTGSGWNDEPRRRMRFCLSQA